VGDLRELEDKYVVLTVDGGYVVKPALDEPGSPFS
jgi:hypothetical protein